MLFVYTIVVNVIVLLVIVKSEYNKNTTNIQLVIMIRQLSTNCIHIKKRTGKILFKNP